jgi:hypothetical protein
LRSLRSEGRRRPGRTASQHQVVKLWWPLSEETSRRRNRGGSWCLKGNAPTGRGSDGRKHSGPRRIPSRERPRPCSLSERLRREEKVRVVRCYWARRGERTRPASGNRGAFRAPRLVVRGRSAVVGRNAVISKGPPAYFAVDAGRDLRCPGHLPPRRHTLGLGGERGKLV